MKSLLTLALLLMAVFLPTNVQAIRPGTQPRVANAIEALETARGSKEPLPWLEKAAKLIRRGEKRINERRAEGAEAIDEAIELVKKGQDPKAKITHAIAVIRSAEDRRKGSNVK